MSYSSSTFFVFIDSANRSAGVANNFSINMKNLNLRPGVQCAVSLESLTLLNVQYPVNSTNNTVTFKENSDDITIFTATVPEGVYTADDYAVALALAMTNAAGVANTYTGTYNSTNGKITIACTLPDTYKLVSINSLSGYVSPQSSFAATSESDYLVNLAGAAYIDLLLTGLDSQNMTSSQTNTNGIFARIPLDQPFGSLVNYRSNESDDSIVVAHENLENINIRIRNPDGTNYELQNTDFSVILKCKFISN